MYKNISGLRSAGEIVDMTPELQKEWIKCANDIIYFAEKYFYIVTIDRGKELIKLHDFQKKMLKAFIDPPIYKGEKKRHILTLSSRQIGKSTLTRIYLIHKILFNSDKTYAILANKENTSLKLLKEVKDAYIMLPLWLQQGVKDGGWNQKTIEFENDIRVIARPTSVSGIRSESISLLILDEFAWIGNGGTGGSQLASEFIASVLPTISSGESSQIIVVSTPNGMNHYYDMWKKAVDGRSSYYPIKINWWEVPGRDEKFKEETIKTLPGGIVQWNQEFGCVVQDTKITVRNKNTGLVETVDIGDFYEMCA